MSKQAAALGYVLRVCILASVYYVAGKLGLSLAFLHKSASPVWPPAGIALAALAIMGFRFWPGIFLGAFLVNSTTFGTILSSLLIATGNTLEALSGAWCLRHIAGGTKAFERPSGVLKFILFAGLLSTILSASIGVSSLALNSLVELPSFSTVWKTWWLGNAAGILILTPAFLLWLSNGLPTLDLKGLLQWAPFYIGLVISGLILFSGVLQPGSSNYLLAFLVAPILLWPSYRFGPRDAATATCLFTAVAVWGTARGEGPFSLGSINDSLLLLQTFMAVNAVISLLFAAVIAQRKQAETLLHDSEKRLETLFYQSAIGLCEKDASGRFRQVNDRFCEITGFTRAELVGRSLKELSYADELESDEAQYSRLIAGTIDSYAIDMWFERKDGDRIWVCLTMAAHRDSSGDFCHGIGSIQDNTARIKAVEGELEAAARLRVVVDTAVDGIVTINECGTILSINYSALRMFGYQAGEGPGTAFTTLVPHAFQVDAANSPDPNLLPLTDRALGAAIETVGIRKDGTAFPVELSVSETKLAKGLLITAIVRDITERKEMEATLHKAVRDRTLELASTNERLVREVEQRARAETILAGETHALELIATGAPSDEVLEVICENVERNCPGVLCSIRVTRDSLAYPNAPDTFGNSALIDLPEEFVEIQTRRTVVEDATEEPMLRDWANRVGVHAVWSEPIVALGGQVLGTVFMTHTHARSPEEHEKVAATAAARVAGIIVDKSRAEERSWKQLAELAHVSRLATIGELASGLAHELNQPLCAIANYAGACFELVDNKSNKAELQNALGEVAKQTERAGEVIRRLREFIRRREPQRGFVDMNKVVREVVGLTRFEIRHHEIDLKLQLARQLPLILADQIQIQQVIVNLIRNAIDAMAELPSEDRKLWMSTQQEKGYVTLSVRDTGRGIDGDDRNRMFESFFTTKPNGMGMGLSISRSIIEMHEGRIWAESNSPFGTTLSFTLPLARRNNNGNGNGCAESSRIRRG